MSIHNKLFDALRSGARASVFAAWVKAHQFSSKVPDEVDHIYSLMRAGVRELGANWSQVLRPHGIALRVTSVFCHQTPKAHYAHPNDGRQSPELGDMLVVHEHKETLPSRGVETTRRAVLVQVKMVNHGIPCSGKVDPYQEYLYEHWPDFELKGRGPAGQSYLAGCRNFRPGDDGGRYGLVERQAHHAHAPPIFPFCCGFPWTFSPALRPICTAGGEDTGAFVANMLFDRHWRRGRTATVPTTPLMLSIGTLNPNNHFDVTVEELLTLTAKKTLRFRNKPHLHGKREEGAICFQMIDGSASLLPSIGGTFAPSDGDSGGEPPRELGEPDFDDGISILLIETGSEREPRRGER